MNFIKRNIGKIIAVIVLIPIVTSLIYLIWLNSIFSVSEPSDKRLEQLFESYTKSEFPKSGKIIEKDYLTGLNDGWEVAIIKVKDTVEFKQLLDDFELTKIMTQRTRGKYGFGFSSKLAAEKTTSLDSIYYTKPKELFKLGYIKNKNIIVFEKEW
ncbi:hypothetical protein [Neotamlana laminarinivorans]|uniref:Uncharacterized protein n=1 Tax=Neotamlana laminarinivorans TaxID=2883124 RepID=A0A9X1I2M4_9FLAO|nr:hypothetical protein [Tamlana laminarinivorans]MCB4800305.1 hypothetical protein [Tamlana laminarinivorans]